MPLTDEEVLELLKEPPRSPLPGYEAIALARVEVKNNTRQLYVPSCPFCKGSHRYGAGTPLEPLELFLGIREVDCAPPHYRKQRFLLRVV